MTVRKGDVDEEKLTACQRAGRRGQYALAMAAYIQWLAPQFGTLRARLRKRLVSLREAATRGAMHRRTPEIVANLALGWELFLEFAVASGAISVSERRTLWEQVWEALGRTATAQAEHQQSEDAAELFVALVSSALAAGRAHLAGADDHRPPQPRLWGWRRDEGHRYRAYGERIGWVVDEDVYLDPNAAYAVAQKLVGDQGDRLPITARALWRRLAEKGLLLSTDKRRGKNEVRKTIGGARRSVLHLRSALLAAPSSPSGPSGPGGPTSSR